MSGIQIILISVIVILTLLLVIVGIQVIVVITTVKRVIKKIESKIDATDMLDRQYVVDKVQDIRSTIKRFFKR